MKLQYRFLTDDDTSAFCSKVSEALAQGWVLHAGPTYAYDAGRGVMRCGQAVVKETADSGRPEREPADTRTNTRG